MVKKISKKDNYLMLFLSLIMNIAAFFLIIYVMHPVYESNDDVTLAMIAENAEGTTKGIMLFVNIVYARLLQFLYSVTRAVKWYVWLQLGGIFVSLTSITYMLYRKLNYFFGTLVNVIMLIFLSYNTYYKFQFTRTAGVCAVAGLMLVFFALEKKNGIAKYLELIVAFVLVLYSSFVRFDSLATVAIGLSVIGLVKVIEFLKAKDFKHIIEYVLVFAIIFSAPLACYVYNNHFYNTGDMQYYTQYNKVRSQLFDLGFPDYNKNKALYKSMGISKKDLKYYKTWNIDTEVLTFENMKKLAEAKPAKITGVRSVLSLAKNSVIAIYSNEFFALFVVACFVSLFLNKNRKSFVALQVLALFLIQFYLTYIGRTGLSRVNFSIYAGLIISQMYYWDIKKVKIKWPKKEAIVKGLAISLAAFAINLAPLNSVNVPTLETFHVNAQDNIKEAKNTKKARKFFNMLGENKEKLYVTAIDNSHFSTGVSLPFFYVCDENANDNIYCIGGWNRVLPVSEEKIAKFNIKNIYRDSINNPDVMFVLGDSVAKIEAYINRNYNKSAKFYVIKKVDKQNIYTLKNKEVKFDLNSIKSDDESILSDIVIKYTKKDIKISGYAYKKGVNTLNQRAYAVLTDSNGKSKTYELTMTNLNGHKDLLDGKYSKIKTDIGIKNAKNYKVNIVLNVDGEFYKVK